MHIVQSSNSSPDFEYLHRPRSVAIVGASSDPTRRVNAQYQKPLMEGGYSGKIYPISRTDDEVLGLKTYRSILDVPGPIDCVIVAIPARGTPQLMRECVQKQVKVVSLFTSGFSETGSWTGKELERTILQIAAEGDVRILGPNCMGVYCPETGVTFHNEFPMISGAVGFLCQSGGNAISLVGSADNRGIHFSKLISYGNALDLNEADMLQYLANDPQTEIIGAYVEGFKDGHRFFELLRQTSPKKPVIAIKGGRTEAGTRAVSSHTGSLAGSEAIWETLPAQTGMITADNLDEMLDLMVTFEFFEVPDGPNAALFSLGGGVSVLGADACERVGIRIPRFPDEVISQLRGVIVSAGTSVNNPVDATFTRRATTRAAQIVSDCPEIDFLIMNLDPRVGVPLEDPHYFEKQMDFLIQASKQNDSKPIAMVITDHYSPLQWLPIRHKLERMCIEARVPIYPSVQRAAKAISKFIGYHQCRKLNRAL